MRLKSLVGSGDRIMLFTLPFAATGAVFNIIYSSAFDVGGPSVVLQVASIVVLVVGVIAWAWSVALLLRHLPRKELVTTGPYCVVKHPIYTSVALLVLPWAGFLADSWLGAAIGVVLYVGCRLFAPAEEEWLAKVFGAAWREYLGSVKIPWL